MTERKNYYNNNYWSGIRSVLPRVLEKPKTGAQRMKDWLSFQWNLIVGKEIASVSHIMRIAGKTLHVNVGGKEWLVALESISQNIIREVNSQAGETLITQIVFKETDLAAPQNAPQPAESKPSP